MNVINFINLGSFRLGISPEIVEIGLRFVE